MKKEANRLLVFAPYFPPRRRVGAIRSYRFVSELKKRGWNIEVICLQALHSELTSLEKENLKGVTVHRIEPPFDSTQTPIKEQSKTERDTKDSSAGIADWVDKHFPVDTWYPLFLLNRKEITAIINDFDPHVIWSTADPWSSNVMMNRISKKFKIPWVADFRDPWTLCDVRFRKEGWFARLVAKKAERDIMNAADRITFTAEETSKKYRAFYPENAHKISTIYNSFDQELITQTDQNSIKKGLFTLVFLGAFRALSSAELITDVLISVKDKRPDIIDEIKVTCTGLTSQDKDRLSEKGLLDCFEIRERVPNEEVHKEIQRGDLLLLTTEKDRDDIIPAKLIDYLPYNIPIYSLNDSPEVADILHSAGRGVQFKLDEIELAAEFLIESVERRKAGVDIKSYFAPDPWVINKFEITQTADQLEVILKEVIKERS